MNRLYSDRRLGSRYELLERLGGGATGEVWRTLDRHTGDEVAAKLLRPALARDPLVVARFVQERAILLTLRHRDIVEVRDLVVEGDALAIVMELVRGGDLRSRLREEGTLSPYDAVSLTVTVLHALAHAHGRGCVHRDVKPDNILLDNGRARLSDFGIAVLAGPTTGLLSGKPGTPDYAAPEVFVADAVGPPADVYSAGIQLYELLAGRTPFAGGTDRGAVLGAHLTALPAPIPGLPPHLAAVLAGMLAKEPQRRPSAQTAAAALTELLPDIVAMPRLDPLPHTGLTVDPGPTELRDMTVPARPPARAADATTTGRSRLRTRRPGVSAGIVAAVAAAAIVVVAVGAGRGAVAEPTGIATAPTAQQSDDRLATGLTVTRTARLDVRTGRLTVTVTWHADRAPLTGPFLEAVPDPACEVGWSRDVRATPDPAHNNSVGCAFAIHVGTIASGARASASYTVRLNPRGGRSADIVQGFLDHESERTRAALTGLAESAAYPAQRLIGVVVSVPANVPSRQWLRVRLLPTWLGADEPDELDVVWDTSAGGRASAILRRVAGGLRGVQLTAHGCRDSLAVAAGRYPFTARRAIGCALSAQVGDLPVATSGRFDIGNPSV